MNYERLAFTDAIKKLQEVHGSRVAYAKMEQGDRTGGLTEAEVDFIASRDSFYLGSIGENGYPYIQHRGGPKGFLVVLDDHTLGMVDFSGNKQYISVGNVMTNPRVSLFLMDYPLRARLKMYAEMQVVEIEDDPDLYRLLAPTGYKYKAERMLLFSVQAYIWNCPQHITPRYTVEEIKEAFAPQNEYVLKLEYEIAKLKKQLEEK